MTEPRARAARHKGQLNFEQESKGMLFAFGDSPTPLPETIRILDEIVTDYIIETCQTAARVAEYSGRQKLKTEDFKFAIRGDELALGRVNDLLNTEKEIKKARKQFDDEEGRQGLERGGRKRRGDEGELEGVSGVKKARTEEGGGEKVEEEDVGDVDLGEDDQELDG